jgi:general secretion pathway protein L
MSLLLVLLPPGPPGSYPYAHSFDGQSVPEHGSAVPALLPAARRGVEVVAVLPAAQLSWHRVSLPKGVGRGSPRLRATLAGLLEEQLLDDPGDLHFALEPGVPAGAAAWVAVCRRDWLHAHLQALDAAQRPVARIVPELAPRADGLELTVVGEPERAQALASGGPAPGMAQLLPFNAATLALLSSVDAQAAPPLLRAEPAVAELAEQTLQQAVTLVQPAQRLLEASRGPWDLAQLELASGGGARAARRAGAFWRDFLHAPAWRPARWGLGLLLLAQLVGLNLWAWRTQDELAARRAHIEATLTDSFPQVKVVVDAPLQMAREVASLRQATGAASARDLEPLLAALGQATPTVPTAIDYSPGELRLKGVPLSADALSQANQRLRPLGYQLGTAGDSSVLRQDSAP